MEYLKAGLDKRVDQARERVKYPAAGDSKWTLELLGHLADEAEAAQRHIQSAPEAIPDMLRLSFTPAAIREHYENGDEANDPTAGMSDEDLAVVGEWALSDDMLYREFHNALESALAEFKRKQQEN